MRQSRKITFYIIQFIVLASFIMTAFSSMATAAEAPQDVPSESNPAIIPSFDTNTTQTADPSFLKRLREELNVEAQKEHAQSQKDGVVLNVTKRFAPESAAFFIAGGFVYFEQLMRVTNSDPLLMVKHIESLKDPIAHASFGAFMLANGVFIDWKTKGMDPMTKQLAMRTLSYKGMAVGSLASSFTADVLGLFKACADGWIQNKNNEESQAACDQTMHQWSVRNKFVQYAPLVLSLLVTQKATEYVEAGAKKIYGNKYAVAAIKRAEANAIKGFAIREATITFVINAGGGIVVKSVKWIGKITKFSMFLAVDHFVAPHVTRLGNNLLQPLFFDFDAIRLNNLLLDASKNNWNNELATKNNQGCIFSKCHSFDKLPDEIKNFSERMSSWRMHLNAKSEGDLAGWLETTSNLLHQIDYAKNFYHKYIENLFATLNRQHLINQGEFNDAPDIAWARERKFPFRTLPLYGVNIDQKLGNDEIPNDLYLLKPYKIEPLQSAFLRKAATEFLANLKKERFGAEYEQMIRDMVQPLLSNNPNIQGQAIFKINTYVGVYLPKNTLMVSMFQIALKNFLAKIGNPRPQLTEGSGYSMAFDTHTANYQAALSAKFDLHTAFYKLDLDATKRRFSFDTTNYKFSKTSDLMIYNFVCGDQNIKIKEGMFTGVNLETPKIINTNDDSNFCKTRRYVDSKTLYTTEITVDGKTYSNITRLIADKLDRRLLGNIKDDTTMGLGFNAWWTEKMFPKLQIKFDELDKRYKVLVDESYRQVLNNRPWYDKALDFFNKSDYLAKNIEDTMYYELEVYISTLRSVLLNHKITSDTYIKDLVNKSVKQKFNIPVATKKSTTAAQVMNSRIIELEASYKEFLRLLRSPTMNFATVDAAKEKLFNANSAIFAKTKQIAAAVDKDSLPAEIKTLLALSESLETLEIDATRFVLMKIHLSERLKIDMNKLNSYLRNQTAAPTVKMGTMRH